MHYLTVITTNDLIQQFEQVLQRPLSAEDALELFEQLFQLLDEHAAQDLHNRSVLLFERFVFPNHLTIDRDKLDEVAYSILVQLEQRLRDQHFFVDNSLMYFPYLMVEGDLAVRRYHS